MTIYPSTTMLDLKRPTLKIYYTMLSANNKDLLKGLLERYQQWVDIYEYVKENGMLGLILTQNDHFRWAIITNEPGNKNNVYRYTLFDRKGVFGHGVYDTPEGAIQAAFDMGYRHVAKDVCLDDIAKHWTH